MDADTEIGGTAGAFPDTHTSAVRGAGSADPARRQLSHSVIVSSYWKPVYRYIRIRFGKSNEDAKDLTQSFFTLAIDKNFLAGYEPERGSFRTYLRTCLDRFLANQHKYDERLKRGGVLVPMPEDLASEDSVEDVLQREWARELFARAVEELRRRLLAKGKGSYFEVFERYDLADERPSYQALALALNLSTLNVTNYLAAARREFRLVLQDKLREITSDEREMRLEMLALMGQ
jgi:RNA polymerase sigma factor (sigma-70 family)